MTLTATDLLALALIGLSAVGCVFLGFSVLAVRRLLARCVAAGPWRPAVSILKPLCGEDHDLATNLRSFCCQDYPAFQIVFGVRDRTDPAVATVERLMAEFPAADLVLVADRRQRGSNLKVANLHNMLPAARHDILVIADSDMRVSPGYLAAVCAPLADPEVGIVTCLYRGAPAGGLWSRLACLHINHGFLPQAAVADAIGAGAGCFGASIALRRETLERIGGLGAIEDDLADDYALGAAVRRAGGRIVLLPYLVDNVIAEPTLAALFRHELRWARTIRLVAPLGFVGSIVTQPVVMAALAVSLGVFPMAALAMLLVALFCRGVSVRVVDRALGLEPSPLYLLPLRDVLSFAVFVASFFTRRVEWRDRTFHVGRGGELTLDGDSRA
ncbi:MAG TPA: bacteriohopanetetrol glucosamine biosynthesis glycosyltransferase HpnI [Stellaceae bacterium]|nr:bacteriohopanetetrol glucosamine biosynthesis glycosyltransferase HpnI [Stellaceae bacterium]